MKPKANRRAKALQSAQGSERHGKDNLGSSPTLTQRRKVGSLHAQFFSHAAQWASKQCGRALTFCIAFAIIVVWGLSGPLFHYSDTWQLVINTGTTIVTFLMVFLIQNTQNRDTSAIQLKLDELIRVTKSARNELLSLENLSDGELEQMKQAFARVADRGGSGEEQISERKRALKSSEKNIIKGQDRPHFGPKKPLRFAARARH